MSKQDKFYVVWAGRKPGIYTKWSDCKAQVESFENAKYKAFNTTEEALKAFSQDSGLYLNNKIPACKAMAGDKPSGNVIVVDAACSGNPGKMEYRGVFLGNGQVIFHQGPFENGTNNIGEFLAIVHALALEKAKKTVYPIYSDSANAILWIKKKKCGTKLKMTKSNEQIFDLIDRAEKWLITNNYKIPVIKWNTLCWGEIPADFGRK